MLLYCIPIIKNEEISVAIENMMRDGLFVLFDVTTDLLRDYDA
jgi:hypothetical protein